MRLLLSVFICLFYFSFSSQQTYVSKTGNNSTGDGSSNNPYLTVQYAVDQASTNDSILIGVGTFEEQVTINKKVILKGESTTGTKLFIDVNNYQNQSII